MSGDEALTDFVGALLDDDAEALYDRAPCGYLSTTPEGTLVKVNQTFLTLTGYSRSELVGKKSFVELLTGGGRIYHETHYSPMLRMQGRAREIAFDLVCADGTRLPVLVNSVAERDADGNPTVVRTAVFDATERREYERELMRAKERAERSEEHARKLATTLQQTLIPPTPPDIPGLDVAAHYRPAGDGTEVGGDFFDVFQIGPQQWAVALGDVCGKGAEAAVVTALVRYTLRAAAIRLASPSRALRVVNDILLHHDTDRFVTAVLLRLDQDGQGWHATLSSGGHPLPLLYRGGEDVLAAEPSGSLLGLVDEVTLHDIDVRLAPGDTLLLYTDGVTEGRRGPEFYGEARLAAHAAGPVQSAQELVDALIADLMAFQSDRPRDDVAVVAVRLP